jgi:hypothetical protein
MNLFEAKLLGDFKLSHSYDFGNEAWITTAISFLNECLASQKGNYDKAASLLASSEWSSEGLTYLAYASFCFWHRPLAIPKQAFKPEKYKILGRKEVSWIANDRITNLVCQKALSQRDQVVWKKVNHRLALACVALKAISLREVTAPRGNAWSFQAEMLKVLPERLAKDPYFIEKHKEWPDYLGHCRKNKLDPQHPASFQEAFEKINLQEVSEKAAEVFCKVAKELSHNDFGGVSTVRAFFPKDGKGSAGCYGYSGGEGYLVIPDTFWACMQTLPTFIALTAHEVLHMHQIRSVERKPDPSSPFYAEYLINHGILRAVDCPCDTYSIRGNHARNAILPTHAYLYRPKEFLTYQFDGAFQKVLAKKFGTPFIKPWCNTGYDELAKAAGVEVELDQPERPPRQQNRSAGLNLGTGK